MTVPQHLQATAELLRRAFPDGISEENYLPLLFILAEHLSDRNTAELFAALTGKDRGVVMNDVWTVRAEPPKFSIGHLLEKLQASGFDDWLRAE